MSNSQQGSGRGERSNNRRGRASRTAADYDVNAEITDPDVTEAELHAVERLLGPLLDAFLSDVTNAKRANPNLLGRTPSRTTSITEPAVNR